MDFFEAQAHAKKRTARLVTLVAAAVIGVIAAASVLWSLYWRYHQYPMTAGVFLWPGLITLFIVVLGAAQKWWALRLGGRAVARLVGARRIDSLPRDLYERRLQNVVQEMALASGIAVPEVYVIQAVSSINAFAAGLTVNDAVIVVTAGTLRKLTRDELQGVIAHEFSHILNGDMRLNVRLIAVLYGLKVIEWTGRSVFGVGLNFREMGYKKNPWAQSPIGRNPAPLIFFVIPTIVMILLWIHDRKVDLSDPFFWAYLEIPCAALAIVLIGFMAWLFSRLTQAAVSKQREFLADASAVQFTRNPAGLVGALRKIGGQDHGMAGQPTATAEQISHFWFAQNTRPRFLGWLDTHPPIADRIRAIDPNWDGTFTESSEAVALDLDEVPDSAPISFFDQHARPPHDGMAEPRLPFTPAAILDDTDFSMEICLREVRALIAAIPAQLRDAAGSPAEAPVLVYGLLLDTDPAIHEKQCSLLSPNVVAALDNYQNSLRRLDPSTKLLLLQIALPALRSLDIATHDHFLATLGTLIQADGQVAPFERTLKKLVVRQLRQIREPATPDERL